MNMGLKNGKDIETLKSFKKDDELFTAYFENSNNECGTAKLIFKEYLKTPPKDGDKNGVWAKLYDDDRGIDICADLRFGIFPTEVEALKMFKDKIYSMYEAANKAYEDKLAEEKE